MRKFHILGAAAIALGLAACASDPYDTYGEPAYAPSAAAYPARAGYDNDYGHVVAIDVVRASGRASGGGALLGGIAGGVLGHQIGSGRGNTAATIAGAVGGAVVGNEVEKRHGGSDYYRVTVRFRDGHEDTFSQDFVGDLRVGDPVHVEGRHVVRD